MDGSTDADSTGAYCETLESLPDLDESTSEEDIQAKIDILTQEKTRKACKKDTKARMERGEMKCRESQPSLQDKKVHTKPKSEVILT